MKKIIVAIAALAITTPALGKPNRIQIGFGPSVPTTTQFFELSYQNMFHPGFLQQLKLCVYHDNVTKPGHVANNGCMFYSLGVEVGTKTPFYTQVLYGVGGIGRSDNDLSGPFPQFQGEFNVGYQDMYTGNRVGFAYVHTSNANIKTPNKGKDSLLVTVSFPIN